MNWLIQTVRYINLGGLLLCLLLLKSEAVMAQEGMGSAPAYSIKGSVMDSVSKEPVVAVTLILKKLHSDKPVKTLNSAEDGSFEIHSLPSQDYELVITSVGYIPKSVRLPVATEAQITLSPLLLSPQSIALEEVKISAPKNLVKYEADKLVYDVANDPESAYLNTFEIMRKVPMLSIDGDDNIELNGNANFQVLLNGRPSSLFVRSVEDALRSLQASSVKSIEIITNPPARYQSEGIGGIINIITHRRNVTGYNGSVRGGYSAPGGPTTGGTVQAKAGKLGFSGLWGYTNNARPVTTNSMNRLDKRNQTLMEQAGESRGTSRNLSLNGELSWQLNDLNLVNLHYNQTHYTSRSLSSTRVNIRDTKGQDLQSYRSLNSFQSISPGSDWGLDYQLGFKKNAQQLLTISYKELRNSNLSESDIRVPEKINSFMTGGHSENDNSFTERTAQIDYVQPLKNHTLEIGLKNISRLNYSYYFFDREDAGTGLFLRDPRMSNQYDNRQDIHAGYVSLSMKLGAWMLRAGARVEQTSVSAHFRTTDTRARQSYFNLIPNGTLSRRFGNSTNLTLSYSQRLQRPGLYYINPFVNNQDPYNIYYGNPDLRATVSHVANAAFNTFTGKTNFSVNLSHTFTNNAILQFTTIGADTVARTTYGNIGSEQNSGISIGVGSTFFKKLTANLNGSLNYRKFTSMMDRRLVTNRGFTYSSSLNIGYPFTRYLRANMSMSYTSASLSFQSRTIGYLSHNGSLNYSFLKDRKGSLSLSVNSPFQPTRRNHTVMDMVQFYMEYNNVIIMHRYTMTFNYRFGKLSGGFKRKQRGITNDDLMTQ